MRAGGNDGKDNRQITDIVRGHKNPNLSTCDRPFVGESATSFLAKKSRKSQVASRRFGLCGDTLMGLKIEAHTRSGIRTEMGRSYHILVQAICQLGY